ncbi:MAG: hypothetical protein GY906_22650 [bacterium]|nr:hypothetical protein [bacterium]
MSETGKTICIHCKHHLMKRDPVFAATVKPDPPGFRLVLLGTHHPTPDAEHPWVEHRCKAVEHERIDDFVTGKQAFVTKAGFITKNRYEHCLKVNRIGECRFYEAVDDGGTTP